LFHGEVILDTMMDAKTIPGNDRTTEDSNREAVILTDSASLMPSLSGKASERLEDASSAL
jgi:hypothetical protein